MNPNDNMLSPLNRLFKWSQYKICAFIMISIRKFVGVTI